MGGAAFSNVDILRSINEGGIVVDPFEEKLVKSASLEVRLFNTFLVIESHKLEKIDLRNPPKGFMNEVEVNGDRYFVLHPGEFALGSTLEIITIPDNILATLHGKSSLGRFGLIVHATAGFVDPGWHGRLTFEFSNVFPVPIILRPGDVVGQLNFFELRTPTSMPYGTPEAGSRYQDSMGPVESRYNQK